MAQAERWANALAAQSAGAAPAVIEFTVERNDLALLDTLFFVTGRAVVGVMAGGVLVGGGLRLKF